MPGTHNHLNRDALLNAILTGEDPVFHPNTGRPAREHQVLSPSVRAGLETPRYCQRCGRRMEVQIRPGGWDAKCSHHGRVDSSLMERR